MPDLASLYPTVAAQRATGRTRAVLRGLVASRQQFIYVVHNSVMLDVARSMIAEFCLTEGLRAETIRVVTLETNLRGVRIPIIFDHVCVEQFLHAAGEPKPEPEAEGVTLRRRAPELSPTTWWSRLRARCTKRA